MVEPDIVEDIISKPRERLCNPRLFESEKLCQLMDRVRTQQWSVQAARDVVAWMMEEDDVFE